MDKKKIIFIAISVLVCLLVYIPTPKGIDPEQYSPGKPANFQELQLTKDRLANAQYIYTPAQGAEDVEIDSQGFVYSGLHDGSIIRIKPDSSQFQVIAKSQGPIFGLDLNKNGDKLAIADQVSGIKILDLNTGQFEYIVSQYQGVKFQSPNAVVFDSRDQNLYFTVSSQKIPMSDFHEMLLYSEGSGRIFSYNLKQKQIEMLADNLYFVNGLEYSAKDNCLFYIETSRSRLSKLDLSPQKKGNITLILDNILGYPDNVKLSQSGDLWVAIPALRDSFSNIIDHNSIIRRVLLNLRVPLGAFLTLANMKYAGGIKVNPQTKEVVDHFFGSADHIDCISGINQKNGKLYLSSLIKNKIAVVNTKESTDKKVQEIVNKVQQIVKTVDEKKEKQADTTNKSSQKVVPSKQQQKIQKSQKPQPSKKSQKSEKVNAGNAAKSSEKVDKVDKSSREQKNSNQKQVEAQKQEQGSKKQQKIVSSDTIQKIKQKVSQVIQSKQQIPQKLEQVVSTEPIKQAVTQVKQAVKQKVKQVGQTITQVKQTINQRVQSVKQKVSEVVGQKVQNGESEVKKIAQNSQIVKQIENGHLQQDINANIDKIQQTVKQQVKAATNTKTTKPSSQAKPNPSNTKQAPNRNTKPNPQNQQQSSNKGRYQANDPNARNNKNYNSNYGNNYGKGKYNKKGGYQNSQL